MPKIYLFISTKCGCSCPFLLVLVDQKVYRPQEPGDQCMTLSWGLGGVAIIWPSVWVAFLKLYSLVNQHGNGNLPFPTGNASTNGGFSIAMLVYRSVITSYLQKKGTHPKAEHLHYSHIGHVCRVPSKPRLHNRSWHGLTHMLF